MTPRVTVIAPCYNDGPLVREAVESVKEPEPVEILVVDDASTDAETPAVLAALEGEGVRVIRHDENGGAAAARTTALRLVATPYVFPLDADDLAVPGMLSAMADRLDAAPDAAVCYGDYEEFGDHHVVRATPERIDPYRLLYTFEYPPAALYRAAVLEEIGGWQPAGYDLFAYEDWHVWMSLAERGASSIHMGPGVVTYRRRVHGERLLAAGRRRHRYLYRSLRQLHPRLFTNVRASRRASDLSRARKLLYPVVYGGRPRFGFERRIRFWLDRAGVWTLRR